MICFFILALPVASLLIGIIYLSISLWKLNQETISVEITDSEDSVPVVITTDDGIKVVPKTLNFSNEVQVANSYDLNSEELELLLHVLFEHQFKTLYGETDSFSNVKHYSALTEVLHSLIKASRHSYSLRNSAVSFLDNADSQSKEQLWRLKNYI